MPFSTQELRRIKRELGYHVLTIDALPYIGYTQLFDGVIQEAIAAEVSTTATLATALTAASVAAPQTLTLASATGFAAGDRCYLDVDDAVEVATLRNLSSTSATFLLKGAHSGTVPVVLEGPIPMAREILRKIEACRSEMSSTFGEGALKKVDEIEFFEQRGKTQFGSIGDQLMYWRDELASILGVPNGWRYRSGSGASRSSVAVSVY